MLHLRHTYKKYLCILTLISLSLTLSGCGNSGSNIFQQLFHIGGQNEDTAAPTTEEVITTTTEYDTEEPDTVGEEDTEEETTSSSVEFQTFTYRYKDAQNYVYEATITLSPWILESQSEALKDAWTQVGSDESVPSIDSMSFRKFSNNLYMGAGNPSDFYATMTEMYFSVGTVSIRNVTDGWSFSENNPGGSKLQFYWSSEDDRTTWSKTSMISKVYYGSSTKYTEGGLEVAPSMKSDKWGPVAIVLGHAENITPKFPDGEYRPEVLAGYLTGYSQADSDEYAQNRMQIRIPIYDETQSSSGWTSDNSGSQGSSNTALGEGLFNHEYIASEQKYKNYHLGFELDIVDDPNWGSVTAYGTPEEFYNGRGDALILNGSYEDYKDTYYTEEIVADTGALWSENNIALEIETYTNRIDSYGFTPEDTGIDTDFDDAYQFSEFYINFVKDVILNQGGIYENLGRVEMNGINGCLVKVRWAESYNTLIIFFSDKLDSDTCFDIYIDTGTPTDEHIPEAIDYLNQHLRSLN